MGFLSVGAGLSTMSCRRLRSGRPSPCSLLADRHQRLAEILTSGVAGQRHDDPSQVPVGRVVADDDGQARLAYLIPHNELRPRRGGASSAT